MLPRTTLLKVSDEDLGLLYPGHDPAALAQEWLADGVALVVVTRGSEGAWAWTARQHVAAAPVEVAVVDTVGAGDTFQAALLTALAERGLLSRAALAGIGEADLRAALAFAAQAAAVTCSRRGADLPRRHELPAFSR
jgi:fructokinase